MGANNAIVVILPGVVVALGALLVFLVDLFVTRKAVLAWVAAAGLIAGAAVAVGQWISTTDGLHFNAREPEAGFAGMVSLDKYGLFCIVLFAGIGVATIMLSDAYLARRNAARGEFYGLLMLVITGMIGMVVSTDLIAFFVSFELMSLPTYVLAGYLWREERSGEASIKYFVTGAFSSAILAFGFALVYAATGQTTYSGIAEGLAKLSGLDARGFLVVAFVLVVTGFGFKISAVPFHNWAPDVYEGAPTPVTAFMAVGVKAAAFAGFARLFVTAAGEQWQTWAHTMTILAVLTMVVGNVLALPAAQPQAHARLLQHRACRLPHAGPHRRRHVGQASGRRRDPLLSGRVRAHEPRRLRGAHLDPQPPQVRVRPRRDRRSGQDDALGLHPHGRLHGVAHGHPADHRLLGQVLPVHRGRPGRPHVAGHRGGHHELRVRVLLSARRLVHVLPRGAGWCSS